MRVNRASNRTGMAFSAQGYAPIVPSSLVRRKCLLWARRAAHLAEGDAGYRRACAELLRRFGGTKSPSVANGVAWTCVLTPGAVNNPAVPRRLAELAVAREGKNTSWLGTLGLALHRCGEHKAAISRLEEAVKLEEKRKPGQGLFA